MGCDIHLWVEEKQGNHWSCSWKMEAQGRDYDLFGLMASVRGWEHLYTPRGLPQDVSIRVAEEFRSWERDAHSASWLTTDEYTRCLAALLKLGGDVSTPYRTLLAILEAIKGDARIVFWFDS